MNSALFSILLTSLLFCNIRLQAQTNEYFEGATDGASTFTSNGQSFTLANNLFIKNLAAAGVDANTPASTGGASNKFVDNYNLSTQLGSIKTSNAALFTVKALYYYVSSSAIGATPTTSGTITFNGKSGGSTVFTRSINSGFNSGFTNYKGFNYLDFATGTDHSNIAIDELEIVLSGAFIYVAIDNFRWQTAAAPAPTITAHPANRTICLNGNTTFAITASNATGYQWQENSGSGFTNIANGGVYSNATTATLTITGATAGMNGYMYRCVATGNGSVNSNSAMLTISNPSAVSSSQTNVSCFGGSNGSATVNISGGISPYTYSWSPSGGTSSTATLLSANSYTVTFTDNIGCTGTRTFTITQPTALTASTVENISTCSNVSTGKATVTAGGGAGGYTYLWTNGSTSASPTDLSAGTHTVTVTDANSCTKTATVSITGFHTPTLVVPADTQICGSGAATLTVRGAEQGINAMSFDGVNDYLDIPDHADLRPATGMTMAAWINPLATVDHKFIFGKEIPGTDYLFSVDATNHLHGRFYTNNSNWHAFTTVATVPMGVWTHVAVSYDNSTVKVYINGTLSESFVWNETLTLNATTTPLAIGRRGDNIHLFKGQIDEAAIWNKALTAGELAHAMNFNVAAAGSGLMGYWKMDEGTGSTVADASGRGHGATLTNGPVWVTSTAGIDYSDYQWSPATGLSATSGNSITATPSSSQTYTVSYITYQGCVATEQVAVNIATSCPPIWNGVSNWTDNPHWTNGSPDVSDSVIVQTGVLTVNADVAVDDLTLENGTTLIVQSGKTLTVKGDLLNNGGTFTVETGGAMIFEGEMKKASVTRLRTFGKIKVMSGSLQLRN